MSPDAPTPQAAHTGKFQVVISAEQIQKRVRELGRHISDDYKGKTVHALAVLENSLFFWLTWCGRSKYP
jgi:hypoxanthine-guanine phosphoribosyltransferase